MPTLKDVWGIYWRRGALNVVLILILTFLISGSINSLDTNSLLASTIEPTENNNELLVGTIGVFLLGGILIIPFLLAILIDYFAYLWYKKKKLLQINKKAIWFALSTEGLKLIIGLILFTIDSKTLLTSIGASLIAIWASLKLIGD